MKYKIVYSSRSGNTRELAEAVREALGEEGCLYFGGPEGDEGTDAELIFAGFWTDRGTCDEAMGQWLPGLAGKQVFLFGTAGFGGSEAYFKAILKRVMENLGRSNTVLGTWMCQGRMQEAVLKRYEGMLAQNPKDDSIHEMIDNYHKALPHPDQKDKMGLMEQVKRSLSDLKGNPL